MLKPPDSYSTLQSSPSPSGSATIVSRTGLSKVRSRLEPLPCPAAITELPTTVEPVISTAPEKPPPAAESSVVPSAATTELPLIVLPTIVAPEFAWIPPPKASASVPPWLRA
jgi:hypothetical protein